MYKNKISKLLFISLLVCCLIGCSKESIDNSDSTSGSLKNVSFSIRENAIDKESNTLTLSLFITSDDAKKVSNNEETKASIGIDFSGEDIFSSTPTIQEVVLEEGVQNYSLVFDLNEGNLSDDNYAIYKQYIAGEIDELVINVSFYNSDNVNYSTTILYM